MAEIRHYQAVLYAEDKYRLGEGPFMDWRTGILSFVDITAGQFYRILPDGKMLTFDAGQMIGAAIPAAKPGTYIFAGVNALYRFEDETMTKVVDLAGHYKPWQRSNDAKADPMGRVFVGSSSNDGKYGNNGDLYCVDPATGVISVAQADTKISNGLAWNKARTRFFFSDSLEYSVSAYDYDAATGKITGRTKLFDVEGGVPDGMCIDGNDNLWLAVWGGNRIEERDSVTGELLAVVDVPAEHTSSCCFMNDDTLFITSSGSGLQGQYDGCLFTCKVDTVKAGTDYCGL